MDSKNKKKESIEKIMKTFKFRKKNYHLDAIKDISDYINHLVEENKNLRKELREYNEADAVKALNDEIAKLRSQSFIIFSDLETQRLAEFRSKHWKECALSAVPVTITPTGIGDCVEVYCEKCNTRLNITDTSNW